MAGTEGTDKSPTAVRGFSHEMPANTGTTDTCQTKATRWPRCLDFAPPTGHYVSNCNIKNTDADNWHSLIELKRKFSLKDQSQT